MTEQNQDQNPSPNGEQGAENTPPDAGAPPSPPEGSELKANEGGMFDGIEPTKPAEEKPRPDGVPEKFWDKTKGELRTDALLKSYLEIEKMRSTAPKPPEKYEGVDESLHEVFKEKGFTQDQAAFVSARFKELQQAQAQTTAELERTRLMDAWSTKDPVAYDTRLRSVFDFATQLFGSVDLARAMTVTHRQVLALEAQMKQQMAAGLPFEGHPESPAVLTRDRLRAKMQDPRYDTDELYRQEVVAEYERFEKQQAALRRP